MSTTVERRLPVGADPVGGGVHFRVWAPRRHRVDLVTDRSIRVPLTPEGGGYFSATVGFAKSGMHYRFSLDGSDRLVPDPASRFQPEGPPGPSRIIGPGAVRLTDHELNGLRLEGQVIYEIHIGTFTSEGTWNAARRLLPELRDVGITLLEIMPVAEFPGRFGW